MTVVDFDIGVVLNHLHCFLSNDESSTRGVLTAQNASSLHNIKKNYHVDSDVSNTFRGGLQNKLQARLSSLLGRTTHPGNYINCESSHQFPPMFCRTPSSYSIRINVLEVLSMQWC